jgi:hypothetical protein
MTEYDFMATDPPRQIADGRFANALAINEHLGHGWAFRLSVPFGRSIFVAAVLQPRRGSCAWR